jgi:hypothetical protein
VTGVKTLGIAGGVTNSIYRAAYKTDPDTRPIEPSTFVA